MMFNAICIKLSVYRLASVISHIIHGHKKIVRTDILKDDFFYMLGSPSTHRQRCIPIAIGIAAPKYL